MPPKSSARGRKKAADVTKVVETTNGDITATDTFSEDPKSVSVKGKILPEEVGSGEAKEAEVKKGKRGGGRKKNEDNNGVDHKALDEEELSDTDEKKKAEPQKKRGKKADSKTPSESDKGSESEIGSVLNRTYDKDDVDKLFVVVNEDEQVGNIIVGDKPEEKKTAPAKRGRKKAAPIGGATSKLSQEDSLSEDELAKEEKEKPGRSKRKEDEKVEEESVPAKRGRKKLDAVVEEKATKEVSPEEPAEPETEKPTRGRRLAKKETVVEAVSEPSTSGRGRRKAAEKPLKETKVAAEDAVDSDKRELKVSIERDQEIDDIAREEATQEPAKGAKGKGKRAAKDEGEKPAKVVKEAAGAKGAKKEKIPDVTAMDFSNNSTTLGGKKWNFKISSWNINGVRAWLEKDAISFLQHEDPDVMCVQETKCSDDKLPEEVKKVEGYHCYWLAGDKDGYSGVGLMSKKEPISVSYGIDIEEHDKEGRVITAEYENFYLVSTYVPNASRGLVRLKYRMQWDKDFLAYLKQLDVKKPVVLTGDLNVAHEEIDLANPKGNKKNAGFTKEERDGFSTLLSEGDFVDTFRHLHPDTKAAYTFWTYMLNSRAKNVGWRLDYFVTSKRLLENLCDNVIRKDVMGSDHCPITLFLSV